MVILIGRLVAWLSGSAFAFWGSYKVFLVGGFLAFLGVSLYSLFLYGVNDFADYISSALGAAGTPTGRAGLNSFAGFIGWFARSMKVPECLSFMVDVIMMKWIMRKIPFIKW